MIEDDEPAPPDPDPEMTDEEPALSELEREAFEERAAIMEYDGGLSRAEAESRAMAEVIRFRVRRLEEAVRSGARLIYQLPESCTSA